MSTDDLPRRAGPSVGVRPLVVRGESVARRSDFVAGEEPLEIRVLHEGTDTPIAVTMRTPGSDFELAVGFLISEGVIRSRADIDTVSYCASSPELQLYNVVSARLAPSATFDVARLQRNVFTSSSCGICGKATLEAVRLQGCHPMGAGPRVTRQVISGLPVALRKAQKVFEATGGTHAAGVYTSDGTEVVVREDVGRHNAVDKVIGAVAMQDGLPAADCILQVSGRTSFEIVQKALAAGIPVVSGVSAPSSLAVDLATEFNMTLLGFVRDEGFNLYTGSDRVAL